MELDSNVKEVMEPADKIPVIQIQVQSQVDGGVNPKSMSLITYVAQDIPIHELHSLADKLGSIMRRQTAKYELENIRNHIRHHEKQAELVHMQVAKIDVRNEELKSVARAAGKRRELEIPGEAQSKQQLYDKLEAVREQVGVFREQAEDMERIIADVGLPNGSANHKPSV